MGVAEVGRLRVLEENRKLRQLVADQSLFFLFCLGNPMAPKGP